MKFEPVNYLKYNSGCVIWITGLSGAGKTTLAHQLILKLRSIGIPCISLDGDNIRTILSEDLNTKNYTLRARKKMAMKYSKLSLLLSSQGFCVITSVIGMFNDVYEWNKNNLPNYFEIFLDIPLHELKKRDSKGIYKKYELGKIKNVAGLDLKIQKPHNPNLHIKKIKQINLEKITNQISHRFKFV